MIRKALVTLPRTLDETYERILFAIRDDYADYVFRILLWLAFSLRPLTLEEVAKTVALDPLGEQGPTFDKDELLDDDKNVSLICSSLCGHKKKSGVSKNVDETRHEYKVILAHYSVKEYLLSKRSQTTRYSLYNVDCHDFIATCCLCFLLHFLRTVDFDKHLRINGFEEYVLMCWHMHCRRAQLQASKWFKQALELLSDRVLLDKYWQFRHNLEDHEPFYYRGFLAPPAIFTAIYYCLPGLALYFLDNEDENIVRKDLLFQINFEGKCNYAIPPVSALLLAVNREDEQLIERILDGGIDADCRGIVKRTCLHEAICLDNYEIVSLLLKRGADVHLLDGDKFPPGDRVLNK